MSRCPWGWSIRERKWVAWGKAGKNLWTVGSRGRAWLGSGAPSRAVLRLRDSPPVTGWKAVRTRVQVLGSGDTGKQELVQSVFQKLLGSE